MMNHLVLSLLVAGSVLVAGPPPTTLHAPDLKQLSKEQFQQLLSKALSGPAKTVQVSRLIVATQNRLCSIPLLELKVKHPERFRMPNLPIGKGNFDPIAMQAPAPACKNWTEGK